MNTPINILKNLLRKQRIFFESLFWGTLAGIFSQGLNFIANILIARLLGEQQLGEYTLFVSANAGLHTFGVIGLNIISTVLIAKYIHDKQKVGKIIPSIYIIVCSASIFISIIGITLHYLPIPFKIWETSSTIVTLLAAIWFLTSAVDLVQIAILIGFRAFKDVAKVSLLKGIIAIAVIYVLIKKFGVSGGILGNAISFLLSLGCNYYFIRKNCIQQNIVLSWKHLKDCFPEIFRLSIPIFGAALFVAPAQWFVNYFIYNNNGNIALSIFSIAYQWLVLIQFFPLQISKVVLPILTSQQGSIDYKKTEKIGLLFSLGIALVIVAFSYIFIQFIIQDLYHFNFALAKRTFEIILLTGLFSTANLYLGQTIIASGHIWGRTLADAVIAITLIISVLLTYQHNIILSLPISYLISFTLGTCVLYLYKRRYAKN